MQVFPSFGMNFEEKLTIYLFNSSEKVFQKTAVEPTEIFLGVIGSHSGRVNEHRGMEILGGEVHWSPEKCSTSLTKH